ncbi:MAG: calcium-translocating P-type ATPase, PMCA-type [Bacteroidaceae bacterium]|nr:calcium-translocating P-type ATPase, PMCA-type [Bacteroidaceae bacterium]
MTDTSSHTASSPSPLHTRLPQGLTDAEVLHSRELHGTNVLTPPQRTSAWRLFLQKFKDPLITILLIVAVLSVAITCYEYWALHKDADIFLEPVGIIVAIILATTVAFYFESKARKEFAALNAVNDDTAVKVVRNGNVQQVPRRDIVVGDVVILETGDEVPADCHLLTALNVLVNESTLTGEPQAAKTTDAQHFNTEATYPSDALMKGTTLIEGYCVAEVTAVGDSTESGHVFRDAQVEEGDPTPLSRKLDALARWLSKAAYCVAALVVVGRILAYVVIEHGSYEWAEFASYLLNTVMIAVALVVMAVPEGLPMSVTLSLAFSMRRLMKEHTLPRTMHACETIGAASVICTDKTGTLTQNRMQVAEMHSYDTGEALLAEMIAANSTADLDFAQPQHIHAIGNPTEGALLLWLHDKGIDYRQLREVQIQERLPFSTDNKYMATVIEKEERSRHRMLYVKGAPEIVMRHCTLSEEQRTAIAETLTTMQQRAMRTLALAYCKLDNGAAPIVDGRLQTDSLLLAAIVGITDPVRDDVPAAISDCLGAGIQVKIVTGDTPATAREIGRQIGLWTDNDGDDAILTGTQCAAMSDAELQTRADDIKILARARPNDKQRLVRALKKQRHVVAVTGDGTNDAPALNSADVGLSMGDGTAVAKEASDMTIQDNSFSTIARAVMWGRSLYKNIQRFILFQLTINVVACLVVLIGAFTDTDAPLTVTQMLWVNLIMDTFAAIALASLPPAQSVMRDRPRRSHEHIVSPRMTYFIIGVGTLFALLLLTLLNILHNNDIHQVADFLKLQHIDRHHLLPYEHSLFFTVFVMLQFWNLWNAKAFMTGRSALADIGQCKGFLLIAGIILLGQVLIVQLGGKMFNTTPLSPTDWLLIIIGTSPVLWVGEAVRLVRRKKKAAP